MRSLETVLAVSGGRVGTLGRVGTFLGVCYDRNLAAARKEKARERTGDGFSLPLRLIRVDALE